MHGKILNIKNNKQSGVSLIIAMLLTSFILSLTFSISNIILRQIRMTTISSNSQKAFFAADSAMECAAYWDRTASTSPAHMNSLYGSAVFGSSTTNFTVGTNPINCGDDVNNPYSFSKTVSLSPESTESNFYLSFGEDMCAFVKVTKTPELTNIYTRGYNTKIDTATGRCDLTDAANRKIVERGLYLRQ